MYVKRITGLRGSSVNSGAPSRRPITSLAGLDPMTFVPFGSFCIVRRRALTSSSKTRVSFRCRPGARTIFSEERTPRRPSLFSFPCKRVLRFFFFFYTTVFIFFVRGIRARSRHACVEQSDGGNLKINRSGRETEDLKILNVFEKRNKCIEIWRERDGGKLKLR